MLKPKEIHKLIRGNEAFRLVARRYNSGETSDDMSESVEACWWTLKQLEGLLNLKTGLQEAEIYLMFSQTVFAAVLLKVKSTDRPSRCVSSSALTSWGRRYYRKDDSLRQFWGKNWFPSASFSSRLVVKLPWLLLSGGGSWPVCFGGRVKGERSQRQRGEGSTSKGFKGAFKSSVPLLCWQNPDPSINPSQDGERKQEKKKREASKTLWNTGDGDETECERMRRSWGDVGDI